MVIREYPKVNKPEFKKPWSDSYPRRKLCGVGDIG